MIKGKHLGGGLLEVSNEISSLLTLLDSGEDHLGSGDVLLGVDEVLEEVLLAPDDSYIHEEVDRREDEERVSGNEDMKYEYDI